MDEEALRSALREDSRAVTVRALSAIAVRKYVRLARAVDIILAAPALLVVAGALLTGAA